MADNVDNIAFSEAEAQLLFSGAPKSIDAQASPQPSAGHFVAPQAQTRELPERRLCLIAGAHLRAQGWKVVGEFPFWDRSVDLAALKDNKLMLIEAKISFNRRLASQVQGVSWHSHFAIALVGTMPRQKKLDWARKVGVGVWRITPEGAIEVLVEPLELARPNDFVLERSIKNIGLMPESIDGGLPCLAGQGPAHAAEDATAAYRAAHPKATWAEIFANVPNHYSSAKSMQSAAYSNRQRRAFRQRLRAARAKDKELKTAAPYAAIS